ncbi:hypothetical protein [Marinagarivorans cellulosilyticus]|uniref:Lipoprotein n=1 Tax=Marinagarivorans cellulosilyticus TaxID=2721545 RepID=A0AAN2BIS0_9GAMM|nr:hypothetical protein [Marinagarivorans cellulosilyticus]BCD96184.1 hypothetical protein MARGE09_P0383 [Marinagarivorans cellulosilyticus]
MLKTLTAIVISSTFAILLAGCGSDNSNQIQTQPSSSENLTGSSGGSQSSTGESLLSRDMTGTWQVITNAKTYNPNTQEYLQENTHSTLVIINDHPEGIRQQRCFETTETLAHYGNGYKTEKHYYPRFDEHYALQDNGVLFREYTRQLFYQDDEWQENIKSYMVKISNDALTQNGTFILSSPIALNKVMHTCSEARYSQTGTLRGATILFPYREGTAGININIYGPLQLGAYEYDSDYDIGSSPITLDFNYNEAFDKDTGVRTETYHPDNRINVKIIISVLDDHRITGSFSFNQALCCESEDSSEQLPAPVYFEGEFDIFLDNNQFQEF